MNKKLSNLIKYGISQDLGNELISKGLSLTTLKATSVKNLVVNYDLHENIAKEIKKLVARQPIDKYILNELLINNNFTCCCCLGVKGQTFIVHHIVEYEKTQDNSYNNLAVLCPTCHDLAHTPRLLTLSISKEQLEAAKQTWETNCKNIRNNKPNDVVKPLVESWMGEFQVNDGDFCSEYLFDLGLFVSPQEVYGHFTITYLNRGNMFMAGEFKHISNIVDSDIEVKYWGMQWGMRVSEMKTFKAIINYGFTNELHIINFNLENDIIPYDLKLTKEHLPAYNT